MPRRRLFGHFNAGNGIVAVPIGFLLVVIGIPTIVLWRLDRRRIPPGRCLCGCDLTGNTSGVCPECGIEVQR